MRRSDTSAAAGVYSIKEFAAIFDVSFRTLRLYEERELLRPQRHGSRRVFSENDRLRMEVIVKAKRFGFSLAEIWQLLSCRGYDTASPIGVRLTKGEIERKIGELTRQRVDVQVAINELTARL